VAGTIFSLPLSQRFDRNGNLLINAPVYFYAANTLTPVDSYADFGLSVENEWPLRTDANGMIPAFWLEDGNYRVRMTDEAGSVVYFDMQNVQALGPSTGEGGGGDSGVDANALFQTGDPIWLPRSGTRSGWVRMNARTIGSATSGATERANADTQPLYEYLWNNYSNTLCPVTGGRGGSAASDFAANKPIAILDMRGRGPFGLDDMGNSAAGVIAGGTSAGASGGASKSAIPRSALPNVKLPFTGTTNSDGAHTHNYNRPNNIGRDAGSGGVTLKAGSETSTATSNSGAHTHTVSGETESMNGGVTQTDFNTMSPYRLGSWFMKL
jgi:hypothetical protein